ncbi:MAG: hypothetical protein IT577_02885 [Verrucomicrobiae bacterium]|nr:hypothetical protein [Verrucomicrobiae bacterium]
MDGVAGDARPVFGAGEASYPSLIQARDGTLHGTYTLGVPGGRSAIKHVQLEDPSPDHRLGKM